MRRASVPRFAPVPEGRRSRRSRLAAVALRSCSMILRTKRPRSCIAQIARKMAISDWLNQAGGTRARRVCENAGEVAIARSRSAERLGEPHRPSLQSLSLGDRLDRRLVLRLYTDQWLQVGAGQVKDRGAMKYGLELVKTGMPLSGCLRWCAHGGLLALEGARLAPGNDRARMVRD